MDPASKADTHLTGLNGIAPLVSTSGALCDRPEKSGVLDVPDRPLFLKHWPLILCIFLLSSAFAVIFVMSVDQVKAARSAELSLETGLTQTASKQELTLTTQLGALPPGTPLPRKPLQPAPWWPALLFSLAFLCGWLFRNTFRRSTAAAADSITHAADHKSLQMHTNSDENAVRPGSIRQESEEQIPDLSEDFPWNEASLDNGAPLTGEEHIARLEKQNATKAEIIKALERLVAENREKWLHQDETEARLDKHIRDLSDDLQVAIRQLQSLQFDSHERATKALEISA